MAKNQFCLGRVARSPLKVTTFRLCVEFVMNRFLEYSVNTYAGQS